MSRERLTEVTAGEIDNDVYKNESRSEGDINKGDKYKNGDPSSWAEDPDKKNYAKADEKRNEMNVGDVREANEQHIKNARDLERKAVKCIVASQRMLPGMDEKSVEANALDLMHMPASSLDALLDRQAKLAESIQAAAEEVTAGELPEALQKAIDEKKEKAEKKAGDDSEEKSEEEAKEAGDDKAEEEEVKEASEKVAADEKLAALVTAAVEAALAKKAADEAPAEEEEKEAGEEPAEEEKTEEVKEASDENLLDSIFSSVKASDSKAGASSLTGLVAKSASSKENDISGLWQSAPDVSSTFGS